MPIHSDVRSLEWYALEVKPRCEKAVSTVLRNKGYDEFLPLYASRRVWSDRVAKVEAPLFPRYLFCRFDAGRRTPILRTPGVIQVLGFGGKPCPVAEGEISNIRRIVDSGRCAEPWPYLKSGDAVRIDFGSLAGLEGILVYVKGSQRLVVSVSLLQRSVAVEIERDWVSPCAAPRRRDSALHVQTAPAPLLVRSGLPQQASSFRQ